MSTLRRTFCTALTMGFMLGSAALQAQTQRDPTQAPPEIESVPGAPVTGAPWGAEGIAVLVREGKPYLVSGTRLYSVGQTVTGFRITRISETEVWLMRGSELRKLPRFAGIQRKPSVDAGGTHP